MSSADRFSWRAQLYDEIVNWEIPRTNLLFGEFDLEQMD
jgi:hypothetical protein